MTFEELDHALPNGFHDAQLHDLKIDYVRGSIVLRIALDFGDPDAAKREDYRMGELRVTGLYFCSIDAPDPNYQYIPDGSPLSISGDPCNSDTFPQLEKLSQTFSPKVSCYRFFVYDWNSFIVIAATDVQIAWMG